MPIDKEKFNERLRDKNKKKNSFEFTEESTNKTISDLEGSASALTIEVQEKLNTAVDAGSNFAVQELAAFVTGYSETKKQIIAGLADVLDKGEIGELKIKSVDNEIAKKFLDKFRIQTDQASQPA